MMLIIMMIPSGELANADSLRGHLLALFLSVIFATKKCGEVKLNDLGPVAGSSSQNIDL